MAQAGYTPISLYYSTTASTAPTSGNLVNGELAINITDGKLYYKDNGGTVQIIASKAGASGDVVGPASATDNAIVRFDGTTGKLVQNSVVTIADSTGDISGVGQLNATTLDATNIEVTNIKAKDGTAAASIADSTGVISITSNPVLSGGTANGVLYLNGSKVATSGSALTWDGTTLKVQNNNAVTPVFQIQSYASVGTGIANITYDQGTDIYKLSNPSTYGGSGIDFGTGASSTTRYHIDTSGIHVWTVASEAMRLTSTGLGIGTSSPAYKLQVSGTAGLANNGNENLFLIDTAGSNRSSLQISGTSNFFNANIDSASHGQYIWRSSNAYTERMRLDSSGNLGIGTSSPASRLDVYSTGNTTLTLSGSSGGGGDVSQIDFLRIGSNVTSSIKAIRDGGNTSGALTFYTAVSGSNTERARITSGGDLLVGTTLNGAGARLKSKVAAGTFGLEVTDEVQSDFIVAPLSGAVCRVGPSAGAMAFYSANTERARITSGGYLKLGGDLALNRHEIWQVTSAAYAATLGSQNTTAANCYGLQLFYNSASPNGTSNEFLQCQDNAATRAQIRSNGGLANYQSNNVDLSDARTKKDITPAPSYWNKIAALEIVTYKYNDQTHDDINVGVIAQQVESVEPVWVDADGFGKTPEDGVPLKTVYTKDITFAAIKALQEAMARIETLEAKVSALEGN